MILKDFVEEKLLYFDLPLPEAGKKNPKNPEAGNKMNQVSIMVNEGKYINHSDVWDCCMVVFLPEFYPQCEINNKSSLV